MNSKLNSVELFTGAGGLAMGLGRAGFHHSALVEWDWNACETIWHNSERGQDDVVGWPLYHADIRDFKYKPMGDKIELVAGGPPCQPFSLGGKHRGHADDRDMFSEAVRALRSLKPRAFIFENVKGMTRKSFADYFSYTHLRLTYPTIMSRKSETWHGHWQRLEKHHTAGKRSRALKFNVIARVLNAANYGVPQRRERVFFVGIRSDLNCEWGFPQETHSKNSLLREQWETQDYWERLEVPRKWRPKPPANLDRQCRGWAVELEKDSRLPWVTLRDAIQGLPRPTLAGSTEVANHKLVPGARSYPGHTGSELDMPAKTLKAGVHGVPGGENTIRYESGAVRYLTIREAARLQQFPDDFEFFGSWSQSMRQLGNAVPVGLAEILGENLRATLNRERK
ncbi:DNA cytosine methyltransferase [Candidatus Bipolaricaulota bacterium]